MTALESEAKQTYKAFKSAILWSDFTQVELADLLSTSQSQLSRAIKGGTDPKSIELRNKLVKILNMDDKEDK